MGALSRRGMLGLGAGAGAAAAVSPAGCGGGGSGGAASGDGSGGAGRTGSPKPKQTKTARPIGDGSTSFTGSQPHQPDRPVPLEPGQTPPQFVVFSWDGAGEVGNGLFPRFLDLAKEHGASMTFFLSGVYVLPESKKRLYDPPNNRRGAPPTSATSPTTTSRTPSGTCVAPGSRAMRSARTSTATSAPAPAASATGRPSSGAARSSRPRRS